MEIENLIQFAFDKISLEELSYYIAHSRSEVTLVKRLSFIIQQELGNSFIVRNEYSDKNLEIKNADFVIFERKNRHDVKGYAEVKWLFSHHLFKEKAWEYKEIKHNHHWTLKKDFQKLLSAKIMQGERLFLLLITHYNSLKIPPYWADEVEHVKVFKKQSLKINDIELMMKKRVKQIITSTQGLDISSNAIQSDIRIDICKITLNSIENVPTSLLYVIIDLNKIFHK